MTILPTGSCFDDVLDHQSALILFDSRILHQWIVHGICLIPEGQEKAGEPFAHAWMEDDDERKVYQSGLVKGVKVWWSADRKEWYDLMRVQDRTRYSFAEALTLNWKTCHFGPWEERYRVLCKRDI